MTIREFREIVLSYYSAHGRQALPWRLDLDPYAILVSEVMLQQTQVDRVVPKFENWRKQWPTFTALAEAPLPAVLQQWQGLGYNRRALNLQRCAALVARDFAGQLPRDEKNLLALPGVGPYTAGAIRAFAFNEAVVLIETNIRAVFLHHYFADEKNISDSELLPLVQKTLDTARPREWYWALMDYGAHLKKTAGNPARRSAHHTRQSTFEGSHRQVRGAIIRALTRQPVLREKTLGRMLAKEGIAPGRVPAAIAELAREGFIKTSPGKGLALVRHLRL